MRIVRAGENRVMPWKNGGGSTAEIAIQPPGAGLDDFVWRLSTATVREDGPFSRFRDVDRSLAILTGVGLRLSVEGREPVDLTPESAPFSFAADVGTTASLADGAVTDLNIMTRRGIFAHLMRRQKVDDDLRLAPSSGHRILYCATGPAGVAAGGSTMTLGSGDALLEIAGPVSITAIAGATAILFEVEITGSAKR